MLIVFKQVLFVTLDNYSKSKRSCAELQSPTLLSHESTPLLPKIWEVLRQGKIMSFFSEATHRFLPIPEDSRIETKPFLDAASEVVPFFGE